MTSSFYNTDFKKEFLQNNFDNLLRESNSKFVNDQLYLNTKCKYFEKTKANYELYKEYKEELDKLTNLEIYYIDSEKRVVKTKNLIKNILVEQRLIYQNFVNHIEFLQSFK